MFQVSKNCHTNRISLQKTLTTESDKERGKQTNMEVLSPSNSKRRCYVCIFKPPFWSQIYSLKLCDENKR